MKAACVVLTLLISAAIMAVCVMVKFATDMTADDQKRMSSGQVHKMSHSMGVISLSENASRAAGERFPYVAAIIKNSSTSWSFSCFASIILAKWAVTTAHCRKAGSTHRILLYIDFIRNHTHTYPILFWRLHEKYNVLDPKPKYDIAVAKINVDNYRISMKPSIFDDKISLNLLDVSVWKTVSTMDKKMYLTNVFEHFKGKIEPGLRCFESYGLEIDESMICVDFSRYEDCFSHEFGPIFNGDKIVGVLAVKPRDCDVRLAIFTNVSYFSQWILKSTQMTYYG